MLLDREEGFWLIHSVPGFPPRDAYRWPPQAHRYGQTLLCVSFPFDQFSKIGEWGQGSRALPGFQTRMWNRQSLTFSSPCLPGTQLSYTFPDVFCHRLEGVFLEKLPGLAEVAKGHHVLSRPWNSSVTLTSKAGATFQSFAKFGKFGDGEPPGVVGWGQLCPGQEQAAGRPFGSHKHVRGTHPTGLGATIGFWLWGDTI